MNRVYLPTGTGGRWLWLLVISALILAFAYGGISRLKVNGDPRVFFDAKSQAYQQVQALEAEFTANNSIIFVFESNRGSVFRRQLLAPIHRLTQTLWSQPHVTRVESLTNFNRTRSLDDTLETRPLYEGGPISDPALAELERYSAGEPRLVGGLLGPDLDVTAVAATLDIERADREQVQTVMAWARELQQALNQNNAEFQVHLAGTVAYSHALTQATETEFREKLPWVLGLMLLVLLVIFRSGWLVAATFYLMLLTNLLTLGLAGWGQLPVTPITAFISVSLIAIVLADAAHLLTAYRHQVNQGLTPRQAVRQSLADNFKPMTITTLTTVVGFLCLNVSQSPPYQQLGNLIAAGTVFAFVLTVFWLPGWMTLMPLRPLPPKPQQTLARHLLSYPRLSFTVVTVALVG